MRQRKKWSLLLIGRAKRAPHWGVQSRFRVIYIYSPLPGQLGISDIVWYASLQNVDAVRRCSAFALKI